MKKDQGLYNGSSISGVVGCGPFGEGGLPGGTDKVCINPSVHSKTFPSVLDAFHGPFPGHKLPEPVEASGKARQSKLKSTIPMPVPPWCKAWGLWCHMFDTHSVVNLGSLMRLCLQKHKNLKN